MNENEVELAKELTEIERQEAFNKHYRMVLNMSNGVFQDPDVEYHPLDTPKKVFRVTERTPWGNKGVWELPVPRPEVTLTEEEQATKTALLKEEEDKIAAERAVVDGWWAKVLERNDGGFVHSSISLAEEYPHELLKSKKIDANKVWKLRGQFARPAKESHSKGKTFVVSGQTYRVGFDGSWRKTANV